MHEQRKMDPNTLYLTWFHWVMVFSNNALNEYRQGLEQVNSKAGKDGKSCAETPIDNGGADPPFFTFC